MNAFSGHEEMRASVHVVCPKPRRLTHLELSFCHQVERIDMAAGPDLLDFLLTKGGCSGDQSYMQLASSPPYLCGSPPSRVANPLIQDARFGDDQFIPFLPPSGQLSPSATASKKGGGRGRPSFGNNPTVRIEGFDCLDRDRQQCRIPAFA